MLLPFVIRAPTVFATPLIDQTPLYMIWQAVAGQAEVNCMKEWMEQLYYRNTDQASKLKAPAAGTRVASIKGIAIDRVS
jgi:hypothetical protein